MNKSERLSLDDSKTSVYYVPVKMKNRIDRERRREQIKASDDSERQSDER